MAKRNASSARIFASVVADEPDAAAQLFHRYLRRLCRLAQTRIGARLASRVDPEDVVMSAYRSFFISARAGRFWIKESGDLWALLAKITLRKLYRSAAHHSAELRAIQRETRSVHAAELHEWMISEQPDVEDAVALADEVENVLRNLPPQHRRIVELRLQGELMADIARDVDVSERTVRRMLSDLETQLQQKHSQIECESIRIIPHLKTSALASTVCDTQSAVASATIPRIPFGDLVLRKLIGAGGMGKVYRATLRATGGEVAVKFLHKSLRDSSPIVERFLAEAAVIQQLNHPGLVRLREIGKTKAGVWFIVMDLIEGRSLADEIQTQMPTIEQAQQWIIRVAEALRVVHAAGIVHCDLKPANVLLTCDGRVVMTDFGLARNMGDAIVSESAIAGSAPWMSPEQIDPVFGRIGYATDIYGLGALLYSLLTGQPPFTATHIPDVLSQIVSQPPVPPSKLRPGITTQIDDLCVRCLQKSPEHRFASATEFINAAGVSTTR